MWDSSDLSTIWNMSLIGIVLLSYAFIKTRQRYDVIIFSLGLLLLIGPTLVLSGRTQRATEQLAIAGHLGEAGLVCRATINESEMQLKPSERLYVRRVKMTYGAPNRQNLFPLWPWDLEPNNKLLRMIQNRQRRYLYLDIQYLVGNQRETLASGEVHCAYNLFDGDAQAEFRRTRYRVCMEGMEGMEGGEPQLCAEWADGRDNG